MKKLNGLIYFIFFVIYEEVVFSSLVFSNILSNLPFIILFSIPVGLVLDLLTNLSNKKIKTILVYIITVGVIFVFGAQLVYYGMYESIISIFSVVNGGQVTEFMEVILDMIMRNWLGILLLTVPLIVLAILTIFKKTNFDKCKFKYILIEFTVAVVIQSISILAINYINQDNIYSNKNLYYNIHMPTLTVSKMGLITEMRLDLQRYVFGFEEIILDESVINPSEETNEVEYNISDVDFIYLSDNERDSTLKSMHEYFGQQMPSEKNEYTGMFEGKNLVVFVAEGFSSLAIRDDLTPTLYKLYNEGFQFDNFYTPVFPVSTADGEYITDTSLIPKEGVWSMYKIKGNYVPYSYANVFENLGYQSYSYHNHTATYYHRDEYLKTMGYNSYLAVGTRTGKENECKKMA